MFCVIAAVSRLVFHKAERIAAIIKNHVALLPIIPNTRGNAGHFLTSYSQAGTGNSASNSDRPEPFTLFLYTRQHLLTKQMILKCRMAASSMEDKQDPGKENCDFWICSFPLIICGESASSNPHGQ